MNKNLTDKTEMIFLEKQYSNADLNYQKANLQTTKKNKTINRTSVDKLNLLLEELKIIQKQNEKIIQILDEMLKNSEPKK